MNHGALGHIHEGKLLLPSDLLKPLSISHDSRLFGIYYPSRYNHTTIDHDFMITPIPFRLWPVIGRYIIRLQHKPGSIRDISQSLSKHEVSILLAEVTRSGHRYDTWNLTVSFDKLLRDTDLSFDEQETEYKETSKEIAKTKELLQTECESVLFSDRRNPHLREAVTSIPHTALSYFYQETKRRRREDRPSWLYEPFTLRYDERSGAIASSEHEDLESRLEVIFDSDAKSFFVFANTDTQDMNIRIAVIPPGMERRFFEATYEYRRSGEPDTSRGLLAPILQNFPDGYNVWKLFNHTKISVPYRERGSIYFLVEDQRKGKKIEEAFQAATAVFEGIRGMDLPEHLKQISAVSVNVKPVSASRILRRLEREGLKEREYDYDVFLSYATPNEELAAAIESDFLARGMKCFMGSHSLETGKEFVPAIREGLLGSREFCLLFTPDTLKREWVMMELGAAWGLGLDITPILWRMSPQELPEQIRFRQVCDYHRRQEYVGAVEKRVED